MLKLKVVPSQFLALERENLKNKQTNEQMVNLTLTRKVSLNSKSQRFFFFFNYPETRNGSCPETYGKTLGVH